jgi:Right handed beta helix region
MRTGPIIAMTCALVVLVAATAAPAHAADYFVDSLAGNDARDGLSDATSWQSLSKVNGFTFNPGDVVSFKRGGAWTGTLTISRSGVSGNPIAFQDYGSGNAPLIRRAASPETSGLTRTVVINGSWIVFQNFLITNAHEAGIFLNTAANHNVIRNNEITATGYGAAIYGQFNLVTRNNVHDVHMIVSNAGGGNYGAGCFFFQQAGSGGNELSYNRGVNCRAADPFFDINGKFLEIFNNGDNLYVHHNYAENAGAFFEAGASSGGTAANVKLAYNVFKNSHADAAQPTTTFCFNTGSFTITISNFVFDNNTVYQQTGDSGVYRMFGCSSSLSFVTVRNNIFYSDTQIANTGSFTHTNNVYYMVNTMSGSGVGYALGAAERISNPLFVDALAGNLLLLPLSPAVDAGLDLGYTLDFADTPVPQGLAPDAGAYEFSNPPGAPTNLTLTSP